MKKLKMEPKYKVTQLLTESQIQGIGGNRWIAKQTKKILVFMIAVLIVGVGLSSSPHGVRVGYIVVIGLITIAGLVFMFRAGKAFFEDLDTSKPIDLTEK